MYFKSLELYLRKEYEVIVAASYREAIDKLNKDVDLATLKAVLREKS